MTIAVSGNFTEGVVLGADSAASYERLVYCGKVQDGASECDHQIRDITQVYNGAQKIYHIGLDPIESPYAGMIYGSSQYAGRPWRNIFSDRELDLATHSTASDAVNDLVNHLAELEPADEKRPHGGVFFCGFGKEDRSVRNFVIDMNTLVVQEHDVGVVAWDGVTNVVQQLFHGVNEHTHNQMVQMFGDETIERSNSGADPVKMKLVDLIMDLMQKTMPRCNLDPDMPIRDAIDYVHFLVYSTIKHFKFAHFEPVCGGEVELAIITRDRGFRRIRTKQLASEL